MEKEETDIGKMSKSKEEKPSKKREQTEIMKMLGKINRTANLIFMCC